MNEVPGSVSGTRRLLRRLRGIMASATNSQDRLDTIVRIIAAEMVAAHSGLGFRILDSEQIFELDVVYLGVVVISLLGLLFDAIFMHVRRQLLPWYRES